MKNRSLTLFAAALALRILGSATVYAEEPKLENPLPGKKANAAFENAEEGPATVKVGTNDGQSLLDTKLPKQTIENAKWTNDGNYLVMAGRNSDGHSPWHVIVSVFSIADREVRRFADEKSNMPIIGTDIKCDGPDGVIMTAHTFRRKKPAPDDPVTVKYLLGQKWASMKNVK